MEEGVNISKAFEAAYTACMATHYSTHERWIKVVHKLASIAGVSHLGSMSYTSRLDLVLRQLENERLEQIQKPGSGEIDFSLDFMLSLSESWVLRAYEAIRSADEQERLRDRPNKKIKSFRRKIGLVRIPLAKGQIQDAHLRKYKAKGDPLLLYREGDAEPKPYENDGSYIIPSGLCPETGAAMWWPVDIEARSVVGICRRELSDEFLALFD